MAYWTTGSVTPFDDSRQVFRKVATTSNNPNINTSGSDPYRMGVELRDFKDIYNSSQPKLWGGSFNQTGGITHEQEIVTYGQALSFTSFFGTSMWSEKPKFNPVTYINQPTDYPLPIIFNDGPQQEQEAIIEPFTTPQRFNTVESYDVAHKVRGNLEDGNALDGRGKGNSMVEQFTDYAQPISPRPWLEEGEERWGDQQTPAIVREGYLTKIQRKLAPWTDQINGYLKPQVLGFSDSSMSGALEALSIDNNNDIRPLGKRSCAAGWTVYGPGAARVGTDSLAFLGRIRGS